MKPLIIILLLFSIGLAACNFSVGVIDEISTPNDFMSLPNATPPGQTIDLTMNMTTPIYPDNYERDWKLRTSEGVLFGVGTLDSPIWVKIIVQTPNTVIL